MSRSSHHPQPPISEQRGHGVGAQQFAGIEGYQQWRAIHADFHRAASRVMTLAQGEITAPRLTRPISRARRTTCTNRSENSLRCSARKSRIVRCSGKLPAASIRNLRCANRMNSWRRRPIERARRLFDDPPETTHEQRRNLTRSTSDAGRMADVAKKRPNGCTGRRADAAPTTSSRPKRALSAVRAHGSTKEPSRLGWQARGSTAQILYGFISEPRPQPRCPVRKDVPATADQPGQRPPGCRLAAGDGCLAHAR